MYPIRVYIYELQDQVTLIFGARSQNSSYLYEEGSFDWECQDELPGNAVGGGHMDAYLGKNLSNCTLVEFCDVYYTSIKCFLHGLGLHRRRKQKQVFLFTSCFLVSQLYTPFISPRGFGNFIFLSIEIGNHLFNYFHLPTPFYYFYESLNIWRLVIWDKFRGPLSLGSTGVNNSGVGQQQI